MAKKHSGRWAIGTLVAAGIGYLAGILTAPKSGRETRKDIKKAANKAVAESEKKLKELHSDLDKLIANGKKQASTASTKAKAELNKAISKAQAAKDKARGILSAVHEGEAADKDLDKAVKDAKAALDHLKQYLGSNAKAE